MTAQDIAFSLNTAHIIDVQDDETPYEAVERHLDSLDSLGLMELIGNAEIEVYDVTENE